MFTEPLSGAMRATDALEKSLLFNKAVRGFIASGQALPLGLDDHPPIEEWRRLDYSTTVTRLYQIFESLVHDSVAEWLGHLSDLVDYSSLPIEVQTAHRGGIGFILQNFEGRRFEGMSPAKIVKDYDGALAGKQPYTLPDEAFLLHERNLRMDEIQTILKSCGVRVNLSDWVRSHRVSKDESLPLLGQTSVDKCLASFIDLRNEASHATRRVNELIGDDALVAYVRFVRALCTAIVEAMLLSSLQWHDDHGSWSNTGRVQSVVKHNKAICIVTLENCRLKLGDSIYLSGSNYCVQAKIQEIHLDDVPVTECVIGKTPKEVGLRFDVETHKNATIWIQTRNPLPPQPQSQEVPSIDLGDESEEGDVDAELTNDATIDSGGTNEAG
jgi:hypothetical protein